jgi:hypothetical protein
MSILQINEMRLETILKQVQDRTSCHAMLHKERKVQASVATKLNRGDAASIIKIFMIYKALYFSLMFHARLLQERNQAS